MSDLSSLPAIEPDTRCFQISSYDTTGGNDDGFSGRYSFIRRNPDSTLVVFEAQGPGVINRIWTPTPSEDTLYFYIDDMKKPALRIRYLDLFSGKVFPFSSPLCSNQLGGYFCYLPIPFSGQCRIVYKGKKTQFHQIQYSLYPKSTRVKSLSLPLTESESASLRKLLSFQGLNNWSDQQMYPNEAILEDRRTIHLKPGESQTLFKLDHGARILRLEIGSLSALVDISKQIDIRISWDNEKIPAVLCPLSDFFGFAFGQPSMKSIMIGASGDKVYCNFPMPFERAAFIELKYRPKTDDVQTEITLQSTTRYALKPQRAVEGKFYAQWNRSNPTLFHKPHLMLSTKGRGHLVGTALQAQGLKAGMTYFFEGDDSTAVDGEFRMHGTGSEDYFNGGWYALPDRWDAAMSLPLSGALTYSLPFCRTGGYRLFLSDKISFQKNIYHSIEHGPTNDVTADYTSISYFYSDSPPPSVGFPTNENTYEPDTLTLYPQLMTMGTEGPMSIRTAWAYPTGGLTYFITVSDETSIRLPLDVPAGRYQLFLDDVPGPDQCAVAVWQRQTLLKTFVDRYQSDRKRSPSSYLCDINVDEFVNTITLHFKTTGDRNQFTFNRLILVRRPN